MSIISFLDFSLSLKWETKWSYRTNLQRVPTQHTIEPLLKKKKNTIEPDSVQTSYDRAWEPERATNQEQRIHEDCLR